MTTTADDWTTVGPLGANGHTEDAPMDTAPDPVRRDSPLGSLKARRAKQQEALHLDLLVPGWHEQPDDPNPISIYVRCRPVGNTELATAIDRRRKAKKKEAAWIEAANADVLVACCTGIYALEGQPADDPATDERERLSLNDRDPHGEWTRFDPDLAETLGMEGPVRAVDVVFALYPTKAQVVAAMGQLSRWSGIEAPKDAEDFFGD